MATIAAEPLFLRRFIGPALALLAIWDGFRFSFRDHVWTLLISCDELKPVYAVLPGRTPALLPE